MILASTINCLTLGIVKGGKVLAVIGTTRIRLELPGLSGGQNAELEDNSGSIRNVLWLYGEAQGKITGWVGTRGTELSGCRAP